MTHGAYGTHRASEAHGIFVTNQLRPQSINQKIRKKIM